MKRGLPFALAAAFGLTVAPGCGPEPPPPTRAVDGRLDLRTSGDVENLDLGGHDIVLDGPDLLTVTTAEDGTFAAVGLAPGAYVVTADIQPWTVETTVQVEITVPEEGSVQAPDLVATAAGIVSGQVQVDDGSNPAGFEVQLGIQGLGTVTDAQGRFVVYRVPARNNYELFAQRADVGEARRGNVNVAPFGETDIGTLLVRRTGEGTGNQHPEFDGPILMTSNGTPAEEAIVPLPVVVPEGYVRRFDSVQLQAPAADPDEDAIFYEWSASSGRIVNPLTPYPRWRPDEYSGSQATLSVTVRDSYGGVASQSIEIEILDVIAGTAHRVEDTIVYSYRAGGADWRIAHGTRIRPEDNPGSLGVQAQTLIETTTPDDPRPLLAGGWVVYRLGQSLRAYHPENGTARDLGADVAPDTVSEPNVWTDGSLVRLIPSDNPSTVLAVDLDTNAAPTTLHTCDGPCRKLGQGTSSWAVVEGGGSTFTVTFRNTENTVLASLSVNDPMGTGFGVVGATAFFVSRESSSGRSRIQTISTLGLTQTIFSGYYNMVLWQPDGDGGAFLTQQEYLALRHPPFVQWIASDGTVRQYGRNGDGWMPDRVCDVTEEEVLLRRVARADWPADFDDSRSELVLMRRSEAFEESAP